MVCDGPEERRANEGNLSRGHSVSKGRHWEFVERAHLWVGSKEGVQHSKVAKNLRGRTSFCKKGGGGV